MKPTNIDRFLPHFEIAFDRFLIPSFLRGVASAEPFSLNADAPIRAEVNVHAVGIGFKRSGGSEEAQELAIRFFVIQKLPDDLIPEEFRIPPQILDLPTDVIESPIAVQGRTARDDRDSCFFQVSMQHDILRGGIAIAPSQINGYGTLGWFCRSTRREDAGKQYILSNWHLLTANGTQGPGNQIFQPPGCHRVIAELGRSVPVTAGAAGRNSADAAIAELRGGTTFVREMQDLGPPGMNIVPPSHHLPVKKRGAGSCVTEGRISDFPYACTVRQNGRDPKEFLFIDQMRIESTTGSPFLSDGDSGSLILERDTLAPVGLLFAKDEAGDRFGCATPLQTVCSGLEIELL